METVNNGDVQDSDEFAKAKPVSKVDREPQQRIIVGNGGKLVVPREDINLGFVEDYDLDIAEMQAKKIRKPTRREWIMLNPASELTTRLLQHRPKPDAMDVDHYYVAGSLRGPIMAELKECRVFVFHSSATKTHALWIVPVTPDNKWYESLRTLFAQPAKFFEQNAIRVASDRANSQYRVRYRASVEPVIWPAASTEELLGEALGSEKFITSAEHPIYQDLVDGADLK